MRFFFLDASALAKRYAPEQGTGLINHLWASVPPDRICIFNIGIAEIVSVLVRKRNAGAISPTSFAQSLLLLQSELVGSSPLRKLIADNASVTAALRHIDKHSINSTDAAVLGAALDLAAYARSTGDDLVLVASDQRLLRAAKAEGLSTFDPEG